MPKIKPNDRGHQGCLVHGRRLLVDGTPDRRQFTISPSMGGLYRGAFYAAAPILVTPDEEGAFAVTLPPSSVMGRYVVRTGPLRVVIEVPDAAEAPFDALVKQIR